MWTRWARFEASEVAVRDGAPPERNNAFLGTMFFAALFGGAHWLEL